MTNMKTFFKNLAVVCGLASLTACSSGYTFTPIKSIDTVDTTKGYRFIKTLHQKDADKNLIIVMFSGGGNRAAALGYGVLEEFSKTFIESEKEDKTLLGNIDLVFGISGGSVLATYFALHGNETVPLFEKQFLDMNFQSQLINKLFTFTYSAKLSSNEYGRGDLLQDQLNKYIYHHATFKDLSEKRKGPFAIISATDMTQGTKFTFTQEFFDGLCLDLDKVEIARAVASSSSVPLIFSPLTFNNNAGHCNFSVDMLDSFITKNDDSNQRNKNLSEIKKTILSYQDSIARPYIHLVDGYLSDNLGLSSLVDMYDVTTFDAMYDRAISLGIKNIIVINVNAQNKSHTDIDKSPSIPALSESVNALINVPVDIFSAKNIRSFRNFADEWKAISKNKEQEVNLHFVSLSLTDLPESFLKDDVMEIATTFYLPNRDIVKLKKAAHILLQNSEEYKEVLKQLSGFYLEETEVKDGKIVIYQ